MSLKNKTVKDIKITYVSAAVYAYNMGVNTLEIKSNWYRREMMEIGMQISVHNLKSSGNRLTVKTTFENTFYIVLLYSFVLPLFYRCSQKTVFFKTNQNKTKTTPKQMDIDSIAENLLFQNLTSR